MPPLNGFLRSSLAVLPNEILFLIARWLPECDRIALATTCRFLRVFGHEHYDVMPVYRIIGDGPALRTNLRLANMWRCVLKACCTAVGTVIIFRSDRKDALKELSYAGEKVRRIRLEDPKRFASGASEKLLINDKTREIVGWSEIKFFSNWTDISVYSCETGRFRNVFALFAGCPVMVYDNKILLKSGPNLCLVSMDNGETIGNAVIPFANFKVGIVHDRKGRRLFVNYGQLGEGFLTLDADTLASLDVFRVPPHGENIRYSRGCDMDDAGRLAFLFPGRWKDPHPKVGRIAVYRIEGLSIVPVWTIRLPKMWIRVRALAFRIGRDGEVTCVFPDQMLVISTR